MTPDEFQQSYYDQEFRTEEEAERELLSIEVDVPVVIVGPLLGRYCLMLKSAVDYLKILKVI